MKLSREQSHFIHFELLVNEQIFFIQSALDFPLMLLK